MKIKFLIQIILILCISVIIVAFYYSFFDKKKIFDVQSNLNLQNNLNQQLEVGISSQLENIEYNSYDNDGNHFYIYAKRGIIKSEYQNNSKLNLEEVFSIINIKNKGTISVYSKNAFYDKVNHNTLFYGDVEIEYLDNIITSQNFDLLFSNKLSKIYNNVIFKNSNTNIITDTINISMETGDISLEMNDKLKKVKLMSKL